MKNKVKYIIYIVACCAIIYLPFYAQEMNAGIIHFKRKLNLYKKFKNWDDIKEYIPENEKNKMDDFRMYFNDTMAFFTPVENNKYDPYSWATSRNKTLQLLKANAYRQWKELWGEEIMIYDSFPHRQWKITDSKRKIAGMECRKAVWQQNDTTRIYAWYAEDIPVSCGPESFSGLPGLILGLATEDGSEVYFAEKIEFKLSEQILHGLPKVKTKSFTREGLKQEILRVHKNEKWAKKYVKTLFLGIY
ncbi:MAG: GLPGLI family protein [Bacteroidia bacterium]|nr:GLPGLI family protein [Bacteroidia bacterium]